MYQLFKKYFRPQASLGTGGVHYFSENLFLKKYVFFVLLMAHCTFLKRFLPLWVVYYSRLATYICSPE